MLDFRKIQPPPNDTVEKYGLVPLQRGDLDLSITADLDLATTVDFDLKLGDDQQNALSRLVRHWRLNEPMLRSNFAYVMDAFAHEKVLHAELDAIAPSIRESGIRDRWDEINDEMAVLSFSRDACAGTVAVVLANLLHRLRVDLGIPSPKPVTQSPAEWFATPSLFSAHSLGVVLDAAAANFRHHDEWARTRKPNKFQMRSISVLGSVLGKTTHIRGNECPEVLAAISDRDFESLNERFFQFVKTLAKV